MSDFEEELALISEVGFGLRDTNMPMLWFSVKGLSGGALLCFSGIQALDFVKENSITNIKQLNGQVCVIKSINERVSFVRMFGS